MRKHNRLTNFSARSRALSLAMAALKRGKDRQDLALLCQDVCRAILRIEAEERFISNLEEDIATLTNPSSRLGKIARRDAVSAALAGRDAERARQLVAHFNAEKGIDPSLQAELTALIDK